MAEQEWTLVEYRPGRYVKVSLEGDVIGKATEAEARAWFSRRGWPLEALAEEEETIAPSEPAPVKPGRRVPRVVPTAGAEVDAMPAAKPEARGEAVGLRPRAPPADVPPGEPEVRARAIEGARGDVPPVDEGRPVPELPVSPAQRMEEQEPPTKPDILEEPDGLDEDRWLWLDPRADVRLSPGSRDLVTLLSEAAERFRAKDWAGGRDPGRLAVHPDLVTDELEEVAAELGLEVVADPKVIVGTFMLGLAQSEGSG